MYDAELKRMHEWKYPVRGYALDGTVATVVTKFGATDKLVLITVFSE